MSQPVSVETTCDQREVLMRIADTLVEQKLAACCQVGGPITSIYRWQGKIENSDEWFCQIKTVSDRLDDVVTEIRKLHSYDEPEITAVNITGGSAGYLDWLTKQSSGQRDSDLDF